MGHICGDLPDGIHLCADCRDELIRQLEDVESTVEAIWASAAKLDVGSGSVGTSGHSTASEPANLHAYDTGRTLNVILTGWAATLGHREPHAVRASSVLLAQIREVRAQDWAPVLLQELTDALNDCRRAMDRAARRVFAGMCPTIVDGKECGTPVYVREGASEGTCNKCASRWDVNDWRERALHAAGFHHGTPAELSRMISDQTTGKVLQQGTIRQWINRGKLTPIGENALGRPVYQVRKVRNLWNRSREAMEARLAA